MPQVFIFQISLNVFTNFRSPECDRDNKRQDCLEKMKNWIEIFIECCHIKAINVLKGNLKKKKIFMYPPVLLINSFKFENKILKQQKYHLLKLEY